MATDSTLLRTMATWSGVRESRNRETNSASSGAELTDMDALTAALAAERAAAERAAAEGQRGAKRAKKQVKGRQGVIAAFGEATRVTTEAFEGAQAVAREEGAEVKLGSSCAPGASARTLTVEVSTPAGEEIKAGERGFDLPRRLVTYAAGSDARDLHDACVEYAILGSKGGGGCCLVQ